MSKYIPGNQKHLSLEDRKYIERSLNNGSSFKDIARFLCKDPTTISKEVKLHRVSDWYHKGSFLNAHNFCIHRYHCRKTNVCRKIILCNIKCTSCPTCNQTCPDFVKEQCNFYQIQVQREQITLEIRQKKLLYRLNLVISSDCTTPTSNW